MRRGRGKAVISAFTLVGLLLAALITLAILQYRWIGDVAKAERQRMQTVHGLGYRFEL